jgi:hypothetical protein
MGLRPLSLSLKYSKTKKIDGLFKSSFPFRYGKMTVHIWPNENYFGHVVESWKKYRKVTMEAVNG